MGQVHWERSGWDLGSIRFWVHGLPLFAYCGVGFLSAVYWRVLLICEAVTLALMYDHLQNQMLWLDHAIMDMTIYKTRSMLCMGSLL